MLISGWFEPRVIANNMPVRKYFFKSLILFGKI